MEVPLHWSTPPAWAELALEQPQALLSDHAHCELGAAASAQSMLLRRPGDARLVESMGALAVEELQHFRRVNRLLRSNSWSLAPAEKNPYVSGLHRILKQDHASGVSQTTPDYDASIVDRLLVAALIERRSLERFELLAEADSDGDIGRLYAELGPSEAGHARLFVELAQRFGPPDQVTARQGELSRAEGELIQGLPSGPRIHAGPA
ncbi:MAG: tRNA-(ms[2]io[6]A)-hydroxylase [Planctomycetota bacterium]